MKELFFMTLLCNLQCEDPRCHVWQHISCVIVPEKPMEGSPSVPELFYCELCRLSRADPYVYHVLFCSVYSSGTLCTSMFSLVQLCAPSVLYFMCNSFMIHFFGHFISYW